jgi:hypothetical protein
MRQILSSIALAITLGSTLALSGCGKPDTEAQTRRDFDGALQLMADTGQKWVKQDHPATLSNHGVHSVSFKTQMSHIKGVFVRGFVQVTYAKVAGRQMVYVDFETPLHATSSGAILADGKCTASFALDCDDLTPSEWQSISDKSISFAKSHAS